MVSHEKEKRSGILPETLAQAIYIMSLNLKETTRLV